MMLRVEETIDAALLSSRKRPRVEYREENSFDALPDDLLICILSRLVSDVSQPADFVGLMLTCKRLKILTLDSMVLSKVSSQTFAIPAKNWSDQAHRFFKLCADAGNVEACYVLGMIRFYCLRNTGSGTSLMAKAAIKSHAAALYSLAVIYFNGSGGSKTNKDLHAGAVLCARAAFLGHVNAMRELGHCLQDGYGVQKNITKGHRFLMQANAREIASALRSARSFVPNHHPLGSPAIIGGCTLLSNFGCNVPVAETHPANRFLGEWFRSGRTGSWGPRLCSQVWCGRPETRKHEFRRCSVCEAVNYCSRSCQALDWKLRHKTECTPVDRWDGVGAVAVGDVIVNI